MDDKSLSNQLASLFSSSGADQSASQGQVNTAQRSQLVDSLKAFMGQAGGEAQPVLDQFLKGEGELATASRAAAASGSPSALNMVVDLVVKKLNISPAIAQLIVPLLLKLAPVLTNSLTGGEEEEKPATTKKKPRKSTSTTKKTSSSAKPKTTAKPKKTTTSSTAKKKTTAKTTR